MGVDESDMEIMANGRDIYNEIYSCKLCSCVFHATREDARVFFENDVCKHYIECPSCFSLILIAFSKQTTYNAKKK